MAAVEHLVVSFFSDGCSNRLNIELAMPGCARRRAVLGRPGRPLPRVAELLRRQGGAGAGEEGLDAQGHDSIGNNLAALPQKMA